MHCSLLKAIVTAQEHSADEPLRIFTNESVVSVAVSLLIVHHVELGQILGCVADGEGGADASFVPLELHLLQPVRDWKLTKNHKDFSKAACQLKFQQRFNGNLECWTDVGL